MALDRLTGTVRSGSDGQLRNQAGGGGSQKGDVTDPMAGDDQKTVRLAGVREVKSPASSFNGRGK